MAKEKEELKKKNQKEEIPESKEIIDPKKDEVIKQEIVKTIESGDFSKMTRGQIELLKRTIATGASDDELSLFIQICRGAKLNPFLRQAHLVPYKDTDGSERRVVIIGIDGYRSIAEDTKEYAGSEDPIYKQEGDAEFDITEWKYDQEKGKKVRSDRKMVLTIPMIATVTVYRIIGGQRCPFTATARWNEYYPGNAKGFNWRKMPYLMLGKCAEALALRKAFPRNFVGTYVQEEMERVFAESKEIEDVKKEQEMQFTRAFQAITQSSENDLKKMKKQIEGTDKYDTNQKIALITQMDKRLKQFMLQKPKNKDHADA